MVNDLKNSSSVSDFDFKLNALLEIVKAINFNFSKGQLLRMYESVLIHQLHVNQFAVYTVAGYQRYVLESYHGFTSDQLFSLDVSEYIKKMDDPLSVYHFEGEMINSVIPVFHKNNPLALVFLGSTKSSATISKEDIGFIQALSNIIYVAFENKQLAKEKIRQEAYKKEIEVASEVQFNLLPQSFPKIPDIVVDAFYKSYEGVGGDYYDFFQLNEDEYALCIADVSGKGVSAALMMSNFQANVRALFQYISSLEELTFVLNQKVNASNSRGSRFITAFLARYNAKSRLLTYVNAGHLPALLINDSGLIELKEGSIGLGMLDEMPFIRSHQIIFSENALLVCYTDGLTELQDNHDNYFGLEKLKEIITDNRMLSPQELTKQIIISLEKFKQDQPYKDDIALLACRFI